jgi:riboflavin synthase
MFTGIIEGQGSVRSLNEGVLMLDVLSGFVGDPWKMGESVAVNGCCLTVVSADDGLRFDLSPETLARTSLGDLKPSSKVNLERAMRADGRFGGHIVQGHVDTTGSIISIRASDNSTVFRFSYPKDFDRYLIDKGSITIDGISLTVVDLSDESFDVWVIPHTLQETNLGDRTPGDRVNLEFDLIAKYVERITGNRS